MGNFKFSMSMLKKEYKNSIVYTITLAFTTAIIFLFFNIIENQYLLSKQEEQMNMYGYIATNFSTLLAFLIVIFCAFMIVFAYNFYVSRKTSEIAIMTMSGSSYLKVTAYLIYQTIVMSLFAFAIGLTLGYGMIIVTNQYIYNLIDVSGPLFYIPPRSIIDSIACIFSILGAEIVYISGYVYRKDIQVLLSTEHQNVASDERIFKYPPWSYAALYVFGVITILMSYTPISAIFPSLIGSVAIGGMIKYFFPVVFRFIKEKKFLENKLILISLSNLYYSLSRSNILIGVYAVSMTVLNSLLIMQQNSPREFITTGIGFIVITILILTSIVYKYILEAISRRRLFINLYKIGYTGHQVKTIIKQEVVAFYVTILSLPMVFIVISLLQTYLHGDVKLSLILVILGFQMIASVISCIITYFTYKKEVVLKGGLISE